MNSSNALVHEIRLEEQNYADKSLLQVSLFILFFPWNQFGYNLLIEYMSSSFIELLLYSAHCQL